MKRLLTWLLVVGALLPAAAQQITEQDKERAAALVERMTLDEKLDYIGGFNSFYIRAIPRLGIPQIRMADGPQGVRNDTRSTMFPCGIAAAAAWDRALVRDYGRALGQDCRARGVHILLGPGVNIYRSPLCGRNFEYYGEDPYLAAETAAAYIEGMQAEGVMACVKHFVGNNQEWNRHHVSSDIDERTLHEIYLPAFRKAVTGAKVGAVMSSYNPLNCVHMTENRPLTVGLLREKWGFDGIFMSDWNATYSAVGAANGGLDLEMPRARFMNAENLRPALENGLVTEATVDEKCRHILQTLIAFGFLDREQTDAKIKERNPFSDQVALEVARGGIVLLKNEGGMLPFSSKVRDVVVMGPNAGRVPTGGGAGFVHPFSTVSVGEGMRAVGKRLRTTVLDPAPVGDLAASGLFFTPDGPAWPSGRVFRRKGTCGDARGDAGRRCDRLRLGRFARRRCSRRRLFGPLVGEFQTRGDGARDLRRARRRRLPALCRRPRGARRLARPCGDHSLGDARRRGGQELRRAVGVLRQCLDGLRVVALSLRECDGSRAADRGGRRGDLLRRLRQRYRTGKPRPHLRPARRTGRRDRRRGEAQREPRGSGQQRRWGRFRAGSPTGRVRSSWPGIPDRRAAARSPRF